MYNTPNVFLYLRHIYTVFVSKHIFLNILSSERLRVYEPVSLLLRKTSVKTSAYLYSFVIVTAITITIAAAATAITAITAAAAAAATAITSIH